MLLTDTVGFGERKTKTYNVVKTLLWSTLRIGKQMNLFWLDRDVPDLH